MSILCSFTPRQTVTQKRLALKLKLSFEQQGHTVTLLPVEKVHNDTLASLDAHRYVPVFRFMANIKKSFRHFIGKHKAQLKANQVLFTLSNLVASESLKNVSQDTKPILIKFLTQLEWKPSLQRCFCRGIKLQQIWSNRPRNMIRFYYVVWPRGHRPKTNMEFLPIGPVSTSSHWLSATWNNAFG